MWSRFIYQLRLHTKAWSSINDVTWLFHLVWQWFHLWCIQVQWGERLGAALVMHRTLSSQQHAASPCPEVPTVQEASSCIPRLHAEAAESLTVNQKSTWIIFRMIYSDLKFHKKSFFPSQKWFQEVSASPCRSGSHSAQNHTDLSQSVLPGWHGWG